MIRDIITLSKKDNIPCDFNARMNIKKILSYLTVYE